MAGLESSLWPSFIPSATFCAAGATGVGLGGVGGETAAVAAMLLRAAIGLGTELTSEALARE